MDRGAVGADEGRQDNKIDEEVAELLKLEDEPGRGGGEGKLVRKAPKGTSDYGPAQMRIRDQVVSKVIQCFKRHGAETIDTPVFERKDILTGKYGEDSKLIYDLKDQGGEILSLRYDLTVPFARYLAMNRNISSIKRYQIGKVYRRDQPSIKQGRLREFYQCDFDIAGAYDLMIPDAECVKLVQELLDGLDLGEFHIKINHRKIIDGIFQICGVPADKFRAISSAVDKLDKSPWDKVRNEMINQKGLDPDMADLIGEKILGKSGNPWDVIETLKQDEEFMNNANTKEGLEHLQLLFKYCSLMGIKEGVLSFDLSLARGLDYYTGVIYEAVLLTKEAKDLGIGSIAAGGRYDNLVGMLDPRNRQVPCVGISIGLERVFTILEYRAAKSKIKVRTTETQVYVTSAQEGLSEERMKILSMLWEAGINAEHSYKLNPKLVRQLEDCEKKQIPWALIIGVGEIQRGIVRLWNIAKGQDEEEIRRDELISTLKERLSS